MDPLFRKTVEYATDYLDSLRTRPVAPDPDAVAARTKGQEENQGLTSEPTDN